MKKFLEKHPDFVQFIKFGIVGFSGTVIDFGIHALLTRIFNFYYITASAISVLLAILNNFVWNKHWVFKKGNTGKGYQESIKFLIVSIVNYLLHLGILYIIVNYTHLENLVGSYEDFVAKLIAVSIVLFSNYFGNKFWTFRE